MKHIGWFIIIWAMLLGFSLQLKAQHIAARQFEPAGAEQIAAGVAFFDIVAGDGAVPFHGAVAEGLTIAQFQRAGAAGRDIGRQRDIGMIAKRHEIRQLDAETQA